jgi:hypothetical protein
MTPMRRLTIDDRRYLWKRTQHRRVEGSARVCEERLRIFAEGNKKAVLQIVFRERPGFQVGHLADGVIWSEEGSRAYNLNRPAVVQALISFLYQTTWSPDTGGRPVLVEDGIALLSAAGVPTGFG